MQTLSKPLAPLSLILILLLSGLTPLAVADSGRADPNFEIASFTLADAGSINLNGVVEAEAATHVVRIQVRNIGLGGGDADLQLLLQGTASSGDVVLGTTNLGFIGAGAHSQVTLFSWTATLGANQILKARVSSPLDPDPSNDEDQKIVNVSRYQNSSIHTSDIPGHGSTGGSVVWSQTAHDFTVKVLNTGVMDQNAKVYLNFTEVGGSGAFFVESLPQPAIQPGSIHTVATPQDITVSVDATSRSGEWDLVGEVHITGQANFEDTLPLLSTRVIFSNYDFELTPAHHRSVQAGQTAELTFVVENTGASVDTYTVGVSSIRGWVTNWDPNPSTPTVQAGDVTFVYVDVTVPGNAQLDDADTITVTLESTNGLFQKTASTTVVTGESYDGMVKMDSDTKPLKPGSPTPLQVEVINEGNAPTSFVLSAGITSNPINWDLSFSSDRTGILLVGESVNVTLTVTPPIIKNPIVQAESNEAGDTMSVWVQATSVDGGLPSFNATPVRILPVIVVDPGLPYETIDISVAELIQAQQGQGFEAFLDLSVEVRHNLRTELSETVNTTLSLGTPVFTSDSSGGFDEASRWSVGLLPTSILNMSLGQTGHSTLTVQGPASEYSVSGSLSIPVTATPTLSAAHTSSNVQETAITQTLVINIPPVLGVEGHNGTILDAMVGVEESFNVNLSNTGNNMTSYRLVLNNNVPDGWDVSFSSTSIMPSTTVLDVPADVADFPSNSTNHTVSFPLVVTTDPEAPANSVETIGIDVFELSTGVYIDTFDVPVRVGELVNATLSPSSQTINLSIGDSPITTSVVISNIGNTPATFGVYLDTTNAGRVNYVLETPTVVQIGAGYESTVRVRLNASDDALAAANYFATVWVSNEESGLNLSANILGNISEQHGIVVTTNTTIPVVPGEAKTVDYEIINRGNLVENILVETTVDGNWSVTPPLVPLQLAVDESHSGTFDVSVPALSDDDAMLNGTEYTTTIRVLNSTTEEVLKVHRFTFIVSPMFKVEVENWPSTMDYHRGIDRTWDVVLTNTGNQDVEVNLTYTLLQGGLNVPSTDWSVDANAPTTLLLELNVPTRLTFKVVNVAIQPPLTLAANLIVQLDPVDPNVRGGAEYYTELGMNRFFSQGTAVLQGHGQEEETTTIMYSHIPSGQESAVAYELELCRANRLRDFDNDPTLASKDEADYPWTFAVRIDQTDYPLNMSAFCPSTGSLGPDSRITLPSRQPWDTSNPITLIVTTPRPPSILPDDGWDLTFRLYHPDEHTGYTVFDEDVWRYELAVFSNPSIKSQGPENPDAFYEGQTTSYSVVVHNEATAQALGVSAALDCHGDVEILTQPPGDIDLNPNDVHTFVWSVRPATIDWWEVDKTVRCDATLSYNLSSEGEEFAADDTSAGVGLGEETVYSWSPSLSVAFVACVVAALLSFIFVRLASQSEKWQLAGVYAGVVAFGFAFHLFKVQYYGPAVLALCALWIWRMTWKSSDEFRLIHEDYQRARKGTSTVYSDHFEALKDSRRQLTIILSIPVLGMLGIVLGLPPQLTTEGNNLVVMAGYFFLIMAGVWFLLKRSDKMYGNLYGRMTDAEVRSIRIERDLGDPARLLNDLAEDGLDFSAILGESDSTERAPPIEADKPPVAEVDFSPTAEVESDA